MKIAKTILFEVDIARMLEGQKDRPSTIVNRALRALLSEGVFEEEPETEAQVKKSLNQHMQAELQQAQKQKQERSKSPAAIAAGYQEAERTEAIELGLDRLRSAFATERKNNAPQLRFMEKELNKLCELSGQSANIMLKRAWPETVPEPIRMLARQRQAGH